MPVHPLQRSDDNALLGRWHPEIHSKHRLGNPPGYKTLGHGNVFPGLSQALHVYLDRFRQAANCKVPLIGQPVAPASRLNASPKTRGH